MSDDVGGQLSTLKNLNRGMKDHAGKATDFKRDLDNLVRNAVWKGPNADKFRTAWDQFKPVFDKLHTELSNAERDVKNQHNDLAAATGASDRI